MSPDHYHEKILELCEIKNVLDDAIKAMYGKRINQRDEALVKALDLLNGFMNSQSVNQVH